MSEEPLLSGSNTSVDDDDAAPRGFLNYAMGWEAQVTLEGLRERTARVPSSVVGAKFLEYNVLHNYVGSSAPCQPEGGMRDEEWPASEIELEVVQYLLDLAPDAANKIHNGKPYGGSHKGAYPLHLACFNADCPVSVIRLLFEKNPSAVEYSCKSFGLPLSSYLRRAWRHRSCGYYDEEGEEWIEESPALPSGKLDCEIVKMLVEANPGALTPADERISALSVLCEGCSASVELAKLLTKNTTDLEGYEQDSPMKTLLYNRSLAPFPTDLFHYLLACNPTCSKMEGPGEESCSEDPDDDSVDPFEEIGKETPLNIAVSNPNMPAAVIGSMIESEPAMVKMEYKYDGFLPIHTLCRNNKLGEQSSIQMLKYLVEADPESLESGVGKKSGSLYWLIGNNKDKLPINIADENKMSLSFCQALLHEQAKLSSIPMASILQMALVSKCSLELIKKLVEDNKLLLLTTDGRGKIPLHTAVKTSRPREVVDYLLDSCKALLAKGLGLPSAGMPDASILQIACVSRCPLEMIRRLVEEDHELVTTKDGHGHVALHTAAKTVSIETIRYLFSRNESALTALDDFQEIPLHKACRSGRLEVVEYLMGKDMASVAARNIDNLLPVFLLSNRRGKTEVLVHSVKYTEIIFKMLLAYPEAMNVDPEL